MGTKRHVQGRAVEEGGGLERKFRLCAYPSGWLKMGLDDDDRALWSTGARAKLGDVQIFGIFPEPGEPALDAVHSIWRVVDDKLDWKGEWAPQARFQLLVRLQQPVPKGELIRAGILRNGRWPQGRHGKFLRPPGEVERLAARLVDRNRSQRVEIRRALGLE